MDRLWTDLEASKKLVDNINTLFQSDHHDEGEEGMTGHKLSGTIATQSNKPHTTPPTEGEASVAVLTKADPTALPLDDVKVEQRLSTLSYKHPLT